MHRRTLMLSLPGLVFLSGLAHADADEWRLAVGGTAVETTLQAAGVKGQQLGFGGRARIGYGISNPIEIVAEAAMTRTQAVAFRGAEIDRQSGDLYADATTAELSAGVRWSFGVETWRALERVHPFVAVRGGGVVRSLSGQLLLNAQDMVLVAPDDELRLIPFVAAAAGVERRFGDHFFVAIAFDVGYGDDYRHLGGNLEVAWSWY